MNGVGEYVISPTRSIEDIEAVKTLFTAYANSLGIDLAFQNYAAEFAALPGKYAPPTGELLLARDSNDIPIACVGLRSIEPEGCCEMKRLYVAPAGRGSGVGKALVEAIIKIARHLGYHEMRLDTLTSMTPAISLYSKFGFIPAEAYYHNPLDDVQYMVLRL